MEFVKEIATRIALPTLWKEFEQTIKHSESSRIWPNRLLTVHSNKGLVRGALLNVDYKFPNNVLGLNRLARFRITETREYREFAFVPIFEKIYEGKTIVQFLAISPDAMDGCILRIRGEYRQRGLNPAPLLALKLVLAPRFFQEFTANLKQMELEQEISDTRTG